LRLPPGASFVAQPLWAALGYALPSALGTGLAAPDRRQLIFLGDGSFQMSVQELSTILSRKLNPIVFLINNDGYTIERLIFGPHSTYNDLAPWDYGLIPAAFDRQQRAAVHLVKTEAELQRALEATRDATKLHLIEIVLPRLDAPDGLTRFARHAAKFDFPHIREGEAETVAALKSLADL
jgi:TPP-dependent 2-oxoacid decarboxylase